MPPSTDWESVRTTRSGWCSKNLGQACSAAFAAKLG
jgi:hypothetical protein